MFKDKKITIEKVNDLLYAVRNEFENELDYDYLSEVYNKEITEEEFNLLIEFLDRFLDKVNDVMKDELEN